jgi:uncharacterized protein (DUF2147 family)
MRSWQFLAAVALCGTAAAAAEPIEGLWLNEDRDGVIRVGPCGAHMCGWLVRMLKPAPDGATLDIKNPDPRLRSRPLIGLPIFTRLRRDGNEWTGGKGYDPRNGRSFTAKLKLNRNDTLNVTGCIALGILCKSWTWTRAR